MSRGCLGMNKTGSGRRKEITTSSRLRAWWLVTLRGYVLVNKRRVPKENSFGEIYYKNHWVLSKDKDN